MRLILMVLTLYSLALAQTNQDGKTSGTPIAEQIGNHHVLLVPATAPGTGVALWIAFGPSGSLAIFQVTELSQKMGEGYRPYTFGELRENIAALISANASLETELKTMRTAGQAVNSPSVPTVAQRDEEARANVERAAADRQQQLKLERARMLYNKVQDPLIRSRCQLSQNGELTAHRALSEQPSTPTATNSATRCAAVFLHSTSVPFREATPSAVAVLWTPSAGSA